MTLAVSPQRGNSMSAQANGLGSEKHESTEPQRGGSKAMRAIELGSPRWGYAGQRETVSQAVGLG